MPDQSSEFGNLTLRYATGGEETILTTAAGHERAVAAMNAGEPVRVAKYDLQGRDAGVYEAAPGAVVAMHFR